MTAWAAQVCQVRVARTHPRALSNYLLDGELARLRLPRHHVMDLLVTEALVRVAAYAVGLLERLHLLLERHAERLSQDGLAREEDVDVFLVGSLANSGVRLLARVQVPGLQVVAGHLIRKFRYGYPLPHHRRGSLRRCASVEGHLVCSQPLIGGFEHACQLHERVRWHGGRQAR